MDLINFINDQTFYIILWLYECMVLSGENLSKMLLILWISLGVITHYVYCKIDKMW